MITFQHVISSALVVTYTDTFRGGSTLGQGTLPPDSLVAHPQIQKLAARSDVISEVQNAPESKFSGNPAGSAPLNSLTDGEGARCPLPRTPPPLSSLPRPRSTGLRV